MVWQDGAADLFAFLRSPAVQSFIARGQIVATQEVSPARWSDLLLVRDGDAAASGAAVILEHERVPFVSYPSEWPPEMLYEAGRLTLEIAQALLEEDLGLKDATPYNVLFRGPEPIFVDVLSVERRQSGDARWLPYGQFVRTFVLPLLVNRHLGTPLPQIFTTARDGIEPQDVYPQFGPIRKLLPPFFGLITAPSWLSRRSKENAAVYAPRRDTNPEKARFVFQQLLRSLNRALKRVEPDAVRSSSWSDYLECEHCSSDYLEPKLAFVRSVLEELRPGSVLDIGCNTGTFSALAAQLGSRVVAIDADPVVVGRTWARARAERLDILPLVVDIARPTPAQGWRNRERPSFLERSYGQFDAVLMLAVIHHLLVTERIPLSEIIQLAADLTSDLLILEFVPREDPMFQRLLRGRGGLFSSFTQENFERCLAVRFEVITKRELSSGRCMYALRKLDREGP